MLENLRAETLSLDGVWKMQIMDQGGGVDVPAAWEVQGYADTEGPARYTKHVVVPETWADAKIWLRFGAVSYYVEVFVNGDLVGTHEGLWTPFALDVSTFIQCGVENTIELHITKPADDGDRFPYRDVLVGFIPYVSTTFGGVWQSVELMAVREAAIDHVKIHADPQNGNIYFSADVGLNTLPQTEDIFESRIIVTNPHQEVILSHLTGLEQTTINVTLPVKEPHAWSPNDPYLYQLQFLVVKNGVVIAETVRAFGFRQLQTRAEELLLNDEPIYLRGVLSWGWNPKTLAPIFTDDEIRQEFRRIRELGFNFYKLCLYVPSERLFEIADEEGMLLWLELPLWLPRLSDHLRAQAKEEYADILARVHHHPSVVIYSLGCELNADMADAELLESLNYITRSATFGAIVCDNSGSGEAYGGVVNDLADFNDYHFYCDLHYFTPLCDHFRRDWRPNRPWIFGEFCDCDDYRDPSELVDRNGYRLWWRNLLGKDGGIHRWAYRDQEQLMAHHRLAFDDAQIQQISRQQSFVFRKRILETVRSRRDIRGYVITGLRDTPMSSSGIFDDLGRSKFPSAQFAQFNQDAVLLLEQGRTRVWHHGGDRPTPMDKLNHRAGSVIDFKAVLANGSQPIHAQRLRWQLLNPADETQVYAVGDIPLNQTFDWHKPHELGLIVFQVPNVADASTLELRLELQTDDGLITNTWPLWAYPEPDFSGVVLFDPFAQWQDFNGGRVAYLSEAQGQIVIATVFTAEVDQFIREGGQVILLQTGAGGLPVRPLPFWRESIKLLQPHDLWTRFPNQGFVDMQFYHLATDYALDTSALHQHFGAENVTSIFTRIDARLFDQSDYLVEIQHGQGRLYATTLHYQGGAGDQVQDFSTHYAAQDLLNSLIHALRASV